MACCGLRQVRFQQVDDETPEFSAELASFPTGRCRRHVALKGRSPVKEPLCAEDAAVTEDEGLFDEKGHLVGLCPGHAAMVISQAVEGRACTGEACSGLDVESGLSKAMPRCGTKFVGKRLYCDQCYEVRVATGVTARSNHAWSSSDVPRPRVRIGDYAKETDLINRIDAMADLITMLYNTEWGREIKLAAVGFKRLAEERINNFRSYPLEVLAVTFEKLMHHFICRVRGQCRKFSFSSKENPRPCRPSLVWLDFAHEDAVARAQHSKRD